MATQLKFVRNAKGANQKEMANLYNLNLRTYQRYESGERLPDVRTAIKMADKNNISDLRKLFPIEEERETR